jgi:hypothetical protein
MTSVTSIDGSACRAMGLTPASTPLQGHAVGQACGPERQPRRIAGVIDDGPTDADRMAAPAALLTLLLERLELLAVDASPD